MYDYFDGGISMSNVKPSIGEAIKSINANAEFSTPNDTSKLDDIVWLNNTTPIAKEDIITKYNELVKTWEDIEDGK